MLVFGETKSAARHIKDFILLFNQVGQYSTSIGVMFARIAENIILFAVAMQINTELNLPFLVIADYFLFDLHEMRMEYFGGVFPSTI